MENELENIWNMEYVAPAKALRAGQSVLIYLPENTFPVEGTIKAMAAHLIVDVDVTQLPQGFLPPLEGGEVEFSFAGRECLYRFWTKFTKGKYVDAEALRWQFALPDKLLLEQKRRFVRVPVQLEMRISMADLVGAYDSTMHTEVVDISQGGICFLTPRPVTVGKTLFIILEQLPDVGDLPVLGDVVRCVDISEKMGEPCWRAAVSIEKHMAENIQADLHKALQILMRQAKQAGQLKIK